MYHYQIYGQKILSNIPLNLPSIPQSKPDYTIVVQNGGADQQPVTWIHDYDADNDAPFHRLGKIDQKYIVRFTGCADFVIDESNSLIRCVPRQSAESNTLEHLLLDQVLPRLLDRKLFTALHAGVVVYENGAVGFVGKTGSGKSTLTAYLGRQGYPVLSDDCLVLRKEQDRLLALPSYRAIRLHPDSAKKIVSISGDFPRVAEYSEKFRIDPIQGIYGSHSRPEPLCALFILTKPDSSGKPNIFSIERCTMREAFGLLIAHTFRLDPSDKLNIVREFNNLKALASKIPVYSLNYGHRYSTLSGVLRSVLDLISELD